MLAVRRLAETRPTWDGWQALSAPRLPAENPWGATPPDPWGATASEPASPWGEQPPPPPPVTDTRAALDRWFTERASSVLLDVEADGAPLASLALAVARATGLDVTVQAELERLPITVVLAGVPLSRLLDTLSEVYGVHGSFDAGVLNLSDRRRYETRRLPGPPPVVESRILAVPDDVPASEVAAAWCAQHASPRGQAAVIDDYVLFRDGQAELGAARALVAQVATLVQTEDNDTDDDHDD